MKNTFIEKFDQDKLNTIIQNETHFKNAIIKNRGEDYDNEGWSFKIATTYLNSSKSGIINTSYSQKSGRLFAKGSISLQQFPYEIRQTIAKEFYTDIDMVNCHVVIFAYLCKELNFDCPYLNEYINNREEKLRLVGNDRTFAKKVYLSILNGGSKAFNSIENKPTFLIMFRKEINKLHLKFATLLEKEYDEHCEFRESIGENYNHLGSFVNKKFCQIESKILMEVWKYYKYSQNVVLCFDGIMVLTPEFNVNDLPIIEANIIKNIGIEMKLIVKKMDFEFDFTNIPILKYDDSSFGKIKTIAGNKLTVLEYSKLQDDIVDYVNENHCLISCGRTFFMKECIDIDCEDRYFELVYKDLGSMKIDFADKDLVITINDEKPKTINAFTIWNKSEARRKYDGIDFLPYSSFLTKEKMEANLSKRYKKYNLFHGLAQPFDELEDIKSYEFDTNIGFFDHILTRWCKNDVKLNEYVLNWFAHLIQKPHIKMGTAIVLKSEERSGKGIIIQIIKDIIGSEYFFQPLNVNDVMGDFNGALSNKLLLFLDELVWGGDKQKSGVLKKLITETTMTINEKHKPVYTCNSCFNVVIASNGKWVVPAGVTSTRYQVIETSDELSLMKDSNKKKKIIENILNVDIKKLAKFFYERDISEFRPSEIINTSALMEQKIISLEGESKWYHNILMSGIIDGWGIEHEMDKSHIFEDYKKIDKHIAVSTFWKWMNKYSKFTNHKRGNGTRFVRFSPLVELRDKWAELNNCSWNFTDDDEVKSDSDGEEFMNIVYDAFDV